MGATTEKMLEEMETAKGLKDRNLDKKGDYLNCTECEERLTPNERWDDICLDCKMESDD
jgi:hypothetical protein|tara:strand:- start:319 stop:495 length:177 start_codon:yes stop_codon:yes gene_type:complete